MAGPRLKGLLGLACAMALQRPVAAQSTTATATATATASEDLLSMSGSASYLLSQAATPTGSYTTYTDRITLTGTNVPSDYSESVFVSNNVTSSTRVPMSGDDDLIVITGHETTMTGNFSATATTTTGPQPTNTRPCNNYVEFCDRKYSNITNVGCHNSPFVRPGNAGSNQELEVTDQLNDGVRMIQAQIQWPEDGDEPHFCHTSCDMLDAGPITQWLTTVREWVQRHPFDVVTIVLGNGNYSDPSLYAPYIESTGILQYAYEPPVLPMELDDWPTLAEMIIRGKRVVMFMDYEADQRRYPWLLDQFSQVWETPFNPVDRDMPCDVQRPPDLPGEAARNRLYLYNHNLNAEYNLFGGSVLVPAVSLLNITNDVEGYGSLGENVPGCVENWGRAPNFLNVDYYNYGSFPGSVFEVAARFNNVTYDRPCCGQGESAGPKQAGLSSIALVLSLGVALLMLS